MIIYFLKKFKTIRENDNFSYYLFKLPAAVIFTYNFANKVI